MIIETTDNRIYRVREHGIPGLEHLYAAVELKRTKAGYVEKANKHPRPQTVSKAHIYRVLEA